MRNYFLGIVSVCILLPLTTLAAELRIETKNQDIAVGQQFQIDVFVDTNGESLNAFEGSVTFPGGTADLQEVRDGNSIVNFWIERPKNQNGAILFSGIAPGGFNGKNGLIFSAIFEARGDGVARFEAEDVRILRNDGAGSAAILTVRPFEVTVSKEVRTGTPALPKVEDRERPESFAPEIARDESLFDGKWFLAFATQDKASGIDHYEVKESRQRILGMFQKWSRTESPSILADQELRSFIWIKATDKAGNTRIETISPQNPLPWYGNYGNWIIITAGVLALLLAAKKLWRKMHI